MGRAIVREPQAFLMDEPLSNLDAKLRVGMRASLAQLHARLGVTTVYVTHDQTEAMTLGQRVAVMRDGRVVQADEPQTLYREPVDLFVAAFIGSPAMNLVEAVIDGDHAVFGQHRVPLDPARRPQRGIERVVLGIRPEAFEEASFGAAHLPRIQARVEVVEELGADAHVFFTVDAAPGRRRGTRGSGGREPACRRSHALHRPRRSRRNRSRRRDGEPHRRPRPLPLLRRRQRGEPVGATASRAAAPPAIATT